MMGRSDNSYLSIGALMIFLPYIAFHNMEGFRRYIMVFAGLLTVICCIIRINTQYANIVIGMDGAFKYFSKIPGFTLLVLLVWISAVVLYIVCKKMDVSKNEWSRKPLMIWTMFLAICFLAVVYVLYDANVAGNAERYAFAEKYLVFNDDWGTRRGYAWKASLRMYQELSLREKLLGYGPDTFGIMVYDKIIVEMVEKYGEFFDSAHNEYLQYLLTIGPIGVISYIVFLVSSVCQMLKKSRNIPILAGTAFTVICYAFQAIVNINLPAVTPMLWLILSMGMAGVNNGTESRI
jgi:O-antigen ligase